MFSARDIFLIVLSNVLYKKALAFLVQQDYTQTNGTVPFLMITIMLVTISTNFNEKTPCIKMKIYLKQIMFVPLVHTGLAQDFSERLANEMLPYQK